LASQSPAGGLEHPRRGTEKAAAEGNQLVNGGGPAGRDRPGRHFIPPDQLVRPPGEDRDGRALNPTGMFG
jgi:hypothetical protein